MSKRGQWLSETRRMRTHYQSGVSGGAISELAGLYLTPYRLFSVHNDQRGMFRAYPGAAFSMRGSRTGNVPWTVIDSNTISVHSVPLIISGTGSTSGTYHNCLKTNNYGNVVLSDNDAWRYPYPDDTNVEPNPTTEGIVYLRPAWIIRWYITKDGHRPTLSEPIEWPIAPDIFRLPSNTPLANFNPLRNNFSSSSVSSLDAFITATNMTRIIYQTGTNNDRDAIAYRSPFAHEGYGLPTATPPNYVGNLIDLNINPNRYYGIVPGVKTANLDQQYTYGFQETMNEGYTGVYFTSGQQPDGWNAYQPDCSVWGIMRPVLAASNHIDQFNQNGYGTGTTRHFINNGEFITITGN